MAEGVPLRPGVHELFDKLDDIGMPRAVATNSQTDRAKWKLDHAGLLSRLDAVIGVDLVENGKPAPDVYIEAAARLGLQPSDCAALDDSDLGVLAALRAGVEIVVQVPDLVCPNDPKAHHQVASLDEAMRLLRL